MLNSYSVKKVMLIVLVLLMAVQVFAQKSTITGVVKNIDGMPIVGAAVQEKDSPIPPLPTPKANSVSKFMTAKLSLSR